MERLFVFLFVLSAAVGLASAGRLVRLNDDNLERHFGESIGKDWVILLYVAHLHTSCRFATSQLIHPDCATQR